MSPRLGDCFRELGISQYLDAFIDNGFDTWETILDITESDLDALGVKLGHRRKLQRRIANARGIAPNAVLNSPTRASVEDTRNEVHRPETLPPVTGDGREAGPAVVQKRKYRRHPKPDENAPERPPSAYVLFSNKMREDLKGQNLTFTEIAKLVGENWQGLTQAEKEPYERQAQAAKEKYNQNLTEYKKTPEYKKYSQYLQDFKAKHANHPQDKENTKRIRLSDAGAGESNSILNHVGQGGRASSVAENAVEPPPRRQRVGSLISNGGSYYAPSVVSASQRTPGEESSLASPNAGYFDRRREHSPNLAASPRDTSVQPPTLPPRREPNHPDGPRNDAARHEAAPPLPRHLPSLSDMFDTRPVPNGAPQPVEPFGPGLGLLPRGCQTNSPAPTPSLSGSDYYPPSLKKEQSSATSMSSGSSYSSYPRTPIEGPLPIHALLTANKSFGPPETAFIGSPGIYRSLSPDDRGAMLVHSIDRAPSDPTLAGQQVPLLNGGGYPGQATAPNHTPPGPQGRLLYQFGHSDTRPGPPPGLVHGPGLVPAQTQVQAQAQAGAAAPASVIKPNGKPEAGLDGISALLQADKFVERR